MSAREIEYKNPDAHDNTSKREEATSPNPELNGLDLLKDSNRESGKQTEQYANLPELNLTDEQKKFSGKWEPEKNDNEKEDPANKGTEKKENDHKEKKRDKPGLFGKIADTASNVVDKTKEAADKTKDTAAAVLDKTKDTAVAVVDKTKDTAVDAFDKTKDTAANVFDKTKDIAGETAKQVELFDYGLQKGAIYDPINGAAGLIDKITPLEIPELEPPAPHLSTKEEADHALASKIGRYTGQAVDAIAISVATGGLAEAAGLSGVAAMGLRAGVGALYNGVFQPTEDGDKFWKERAWNTAAGAGTGALNKGGDTVVGPIVKNAPEGIAKAASDIASDALVGSATNATLSQGKSLMVDGKPESKDEVILSGLQGLGRLVNSK